MHLICASFLDRMGRLIRESERQNYNALNIFTFSREQMAANLDIWAMRKQDATEFHSGVVTRWKVMFLVWIDNHIYC